ncbi:DivIVA domain-containing protein [Arthrobacter sp. ATA002]|uniref:DivIVA domain-containing protein n=1 Tax=Arthrobacter sp. ATA002 TaxID=2991715 RepID=UPI0022A7D1D9|nr:DivIVA domain-containing protein [Arthrobacter sp. ATA002]WAP52673.1 DivIVA domain-containing protein [Arthrobacter sp. ATA002]
MTTLLVFLAIVAAGAVALLASGLPRQRKSAAGPGTDGGGAPLTGPGGDPGLAEPDPRLPPVLLPDRVRPSDIGRLRFSVALRGYRMDQVDEVLAKLAAALAERDAALTAVMSPSPGISPERPDGPEHPEDPEVRQ